MKATCAECGWTGPLADLELSEVFQNLLVCPECGRRWMQLRTEKKGG